MLPLFGSELMLSHVLAQASNDPGVSFGNMMLFVYLILFGGILYFLIIRPLQKRRSAIREHRSAVHTATTNIMSCEYCGQTFDDGDQYCSNCGGALIKNGLQACAADLVPSRNVPRLRWLVLVVAIILAGAGGGFYFLYLNHLPDGAIWKSKGEAIYGSNDAILFIQSGGEMQALNRNDGKVIWQRIERDLGPFTADGTIAILEKEHQLEAIDVKDGKTLWTFEVGAYSKQKGTLDSPTLKNGSLYFQDDNFIYALDSKTGSLVWKYACDCNASQEQPVIDGETLYGKCDLTKIAAINLSDGEELWKFVDDVCSGYGGASAECVGNYYALEANSAMRGPSPISIANSLMSVELKILYVLDSTKGTKKWTTDMRPIAIFNSTLVAADGRSLVGLEPSSGREKWRHDFDSSIAGGLSGTLPRSSKNRIYVVDFSGLHILSAENGKELKLFGKNWYSGVSNYADVEVAQNEEIYVSDKSNIFAFKKF